jgi:hypothetical protein
MRRQANVQRRVEHFASFLTLLSEVRRLGVDSPYLSQVRIVALAQAAIAGRDNQQTAKGVQRWSDGCQDCWSLRLS